MAFDEDDEAPEALPDLSWAERARAVLPMGTSTGSKRSESLWGSADTNAPTHYLGAAG